MRTIQFRLLSNDSDVSSSVGTLNGTLIESTTGSLLVFDTEFCGACIHESPHNDIKAPAKFIGTFIASRAEHHGYKFIHIEDQVVPIEYDYDDGSKVFYIHPRTKQLIPRGTVFTAEVDGEVFELNVSEILRNYIKKT